MKKMRGNETRRRMPNHRILMLSAWSFTLVFSSFLFMFAGRWLDREMGTEPAFMLGLFILGIGLCIGRIYTDYIKAKDELDRKRITYPSQHIVKKA